MKFIFKIINMAQRWGLPHSPFKRRDPLVVVDVSKDIDRMVRLQKKIQKLPFECGGVMLWVIYHELLPDAMKCGFNRFTNLRVAMMNHRKTARESTPRVPRVKFDPNIQQYSDAFEKLYDCSALTLILERVDKDFRETCSEYRKMMRAYDEALQAHIGNDLVLVLKIPQEYAEYVERANAEIDAPFKMWKNKDSVVDYCMKRLEHYTEKMELGEITHNEFVGIVRGERFLFTRKFLHYFRLTEVDVEMYTMAIEDIMRSHDVPEFRSTIMAMKMVLNELEDVDIHFSGVSSDNVSIPIAVVDDIEKRVSQNVANFKKHTLDIIDHMKELARSCDRVKLNRFFDNERCNIDAALLIRSTIGHPMGFSCCHHFTASDLFPDMHRYVPSDSFKLRRKLVMNCSGDLELARTEESRKVKH